MSSWWICASKIWKHTPVDMYYEMPIHKELDQGRAETSPTLLLVICTVKASIFVFESLNCKNLKHCWEIYAIYLQACNSLTTLRWWFHTTVSWYNRLFLAKGTSLVPPSTDSSLPFPMQPHQLSFAMSDAHLAVELFTQPVRAEKRSRRSQQDRGRSKWGKRKELFVWMGIYIYYKLELFTLNAQGQRSV